MSDGCSMEQTARSPPHLTQARLSATPLSRRVGSSSHVHNILPSTGFEIQHSTLASTVRLSVQHRFHHQRTSPLFQTR